MHRMNFHNGARRSSLSFDMRRYSLAFLTVNELDPVSAIHTAAQCGYDAVGLRLLKASPQEEDYPLLSDKRLLEEVLHALKETGISVGDVELIRLKPETKVESFKAFFERAQLLGAEHVIVAGDDAERNRMGEKFADLCTLAHTYNIRVNLEPMPWTQVPDIKTALAIVEDAAMKNAGILVDALHLHRAGDTIETLQSIPQELIQLFQICDAPANFDASHTALIHTARSNRLFPGDGEIDLKGILTCIPDSTMISVEVPNTNITSPQQRAMQALKATKRIVENHSY